MNSIYSGQQFFSYTCSPFSVAAAKFQSFL
jgi:hypothetical protein